LVSLFFIPTHSYRIRKMKHSSSDVEKEALIRH
jgi:hypothetical protein